MNWKFWEKPKHDIEFIDTSRQAYQMHPVELAKPIRPHFYKDMMQKQGEYKFAQCPGMIDYKNYGYVIPAWDDIHIMANKAGSVVHVGGGSRPSAFLKARQMNAKIVDGVFEPEGVPLQVWHVGSPWSIFVHNKNVSAALMPAFYHSPFLDDLHIFPGLVDYNEKFTVINFIFACKRPCEMTIKVGTPLIQVLPFESKNLTAGYGPADQYQMDQSKSIFSSSKQFYRKYIMNEKKTTLEETNENIR